MKKKSVFILTIALILTLISSIAAYAFQDLSGDAESEKIMSLKERNIIQGISSSLFAPNQQLTYAQAIELTVKGFDFNLNHIRFIKEPLASDYFENVADDAWYANSFINAVHNGISIPKEINPTKIVSREQLADLLIQAIHTKGDFATIMIWILLEDEDQVSPEYMSSVQTMLITQIMSLDENNNFHPKASVTRSEAASFLHDAIKFVEELSLEPSLPVDEDISINIEKVNEDINKLIIDWGEKPNTGYRVTIDSISFDQEQKTAVVHYGLHHPLPDHMYSEVITYPEASTYISSEYEISIRIIQ